MLFAIVGDERAYAAKGLSGTCPGCREPVIPKCGTLKVHHWAHRAGVDCDSWAEPIGVWNHWAKAEEHMKAGRIPALKNSTKDRILSLSEEFARSSDRRNFWKPRVVGETDEADECNRWP